MEILELKNIASEMKNSLDSLNKMLDMRKQKCYKSEKCNPFLKREISKLSSGTLKLQGG